MQLVVESSVIQMDGTAVALRIYVHLSNCSPFHSFYLFYFAFFPTIAEPLHFFSSIGWMQIAYFYFYFVSIHRFKLFHFFFESLSTFMQLFLVYSNTTEISSDFFTLFVIFVVVVIQTMMETMCICNAFMS